MMRAAGKPALVDLQEFSNAKPNASALTAAVLEVQLKEVDEQAHQRGFYAGRAAVSAETEVLLAQLAKRYEDDLYAAKQDWHRQTSEMLIGAMQTAVTKLSEAIELSVARLLKPWLMAKIHDQAVIDFHAAVERAFTDGASIEVSGPKDMIVGIADLVATRTPRLVLSPDERATVHVKIDDAFISANFVEWKSQLERLEL
jgi:hypothetical protein